MNREIEICERLKEVEERISSAASASGRTRSQITLIAVTKNFPVSDIAILKGLGVNDFGENRDSEASQKASEVKARWHFQGQIQSNKLKSICTWAEVIHSLDDLRHFELIQKFAPHPLDIFLQVNLDGLEHRGGGSIQSLYPLAEKVAADSHHSLLGLMAVAPLGIDVASSFENLQGLHEAFMRDFPMATKLSAGMSADFEIALSFGATHIRIGSEIMGSRYLGR